MSPFARICILTCAATAPVAAQSIPPDVPPPVTRRLMQAMWPEYLFDSMGRPEEPISRRARWPKTMGYPNYPDLRIAIKHLAVPRLGNVTLYVATTTASCSDCGQYVRVVAQHGTAMITLIEDSDIGLLLDQASPPFLTGDSVDVREAAFALLRASCFSGCDLRWVGRQSDVSEPYVRNALKPDSGYATWDDSATGSAVHDGRLTAWLHVQVSRTILRVSVAATSNGRWLLTTNFVAGNDGP